MLIMLTFSLRFLPLSPQRDCAATRRPRPPFRPALEPLDERTLPSATATIAVLGDSLSASYQGTPQGAAGDRNWVQQLQAEGVVVQYGDIMPAIAGSPGPNCTTTAEISKHVAIDDVAVPGASSADLGDQLAKVVPLVQAGSVHYATLIVGSADVLAKANLPSILAGNPWPFVTEVVHNIESALKTLAHAGDVHLVVGNIPDISITPAFRAQFPNPLLRQEVTQATTLANQQIEAFAASRGIPVIDLFGLGHLADQPLTLAGVQIDAHYLYAPDGFHPGSVPQGILADTILEALGDAYDPTFERLTLTEEQILGNAAPPIAHQPGDTFFDVSPFVLVNGNHDADGDGAGWAAGSSPAASDKGLEALDGLFGTADAGLPGETVFGSLPL
jgi:lysophospholipase L1-like esterase